MDGGDGFDADCEESLVIVNPLCAGQLDVGSDVGVIAGRSLHHHWQAVFSSLQAAITVHWQPLRGNKVNIVYTKVSIHQDVYVKDIISTAIIFLPVFLFLKDQSS